MGWGGVGWGGVGWGGVGGSVGEYGLGRGKVGGSRAARSYPGPTATRNGREGAGVWGWVGRGV